MSGEYERASIVEPAREIPVYRRVEVVVVGGGPAGIAAAIAAARNGAETLLIERNTTLGGTGPMAFVTEFHGSEFLGGIPRELVRRLGEEGGAASQIDDGIFAVAFDPELLKLVLLEMVEEAGVHVLTGTWTVDAVLDDKTVKGIVIENKSGRQAILADVVIDASGDADVAARVGVDMQPYATPQPMMMLFRMGGVDYRRIEDFARAHMDDFMMNWGVPPGRFDGVMNVHMSGWFSFVERAKQKGQLPIGFGNYFSLFGATPAALQNGIGFIYAVRVLRRDPYNADDLSAAEHEGRKGVRGFVPFLKTIPGFESSFLIDIAPNIGVRDSRRIVGDYTLSSDDVFEGLTHEDDIFVRYQKGPKIAGWVRHPPDGSEGSRKHLHEMEKVSREVSIFGIPYRTLLPAGVDRLLVAGKTISMDYEAHTRCRTMPDCMAFGQAAGTAAAHAVRAKLAPRDIDVRALRAQLLAQGANISPDAIDLSKVKKRGLDLVEAAKAV